MQNNPTINEVRGDELIMPGKKGLAALYPINWNYVISAPVIYGMAIPIIFFHICLEIYHQFCFRFYDIPLVKSSKYFIYDRQLWPCLSWIQKANCLYCSYFNNLIRYATEIGARTERYWCPIKYEKKITNAHSQYGKFIEEKDTDDFREKWEDLRDFSDVAKKDKDK